MWHLIVSTPDLCTLTYFDTYRKLVKSVLSLLSQVPNWATCLNFAVNALARLRGRTGSPEPLLVAFSISNIISRAYPNIYYSNFDNGHVYSIFNSMDVKLET